MKHASARNIIERTFTLLKACWAILRSPSFYDIDDQLHNVVLIEMSVDPLKTMVNEATSIGDAENTEYIGTVQTNSVWNTWRDEIAKSMYNDWRGHS
ncbi:UNVERIFIED_CONTAM: hypothetical protein Sradi_2078400 [Sesamum radiatum]|uniref:Transposase n=1 Tax=Sesamum radiatum TaxID=300843 RepID=A0AAW2TI32_SESRA